LDIQAESSGENALVGEIRHLLDALRTERQSIAQPVQGQPLPLKYNKNAGVSLTEDDLKSLQGIFRMEELPNIGKMDWDGFGFKNSHTYATWINNLLINFRATPIESTYILSIAFMCRKQSRIMMHIDRFNKYPWYQRVKEFFAKRTCDYTYEENEGRKVAIHHFSNAYPYVAALVWVRTTHKANRSIAHFLENTWAAQLALTDDLMMEQRKWEMVLWNEKIKKGGKDFQSGGFNESYWTTKSSDCYPLIVDTGGTFLGKKEKELYNREELQ